MVSAQLTFHDVLDGKGKAHLPLIGDKDFWIGEYNPDYAIVEEYCLGIGADDELAAHFHNMTLQTITDLRDNISAVIGATHMQFIIPKEVARQMTPLPVSKGLYRAEDIALDRKIDELGYLHLSALKNHVMHMGNNINERLLIEIQALDNLPKQLQLSYTDKQIINTNSMLFRWLTRLSRNKRLNRTFLRVYDLIYRVLYSD